MPERQMLRVKDLSKDVWHGAVASGASAIILNTFTLCSDYLSIVNFEAIIIQRFKIGT